MIATAFNPPALRTDAKGPALQPWHFLESAHPGPYFALIVDIGSARAYFGDGRKSALRGAIACGRRLRVGCGVRRHKDPWCPPPDGRDPNHAEMSSDL